MSQSKSLLPRAYETAFPFGNVGHGEAFPIVTSLDAGQDRENIAKTSAMPLELSLRDTFISGNEGREDMDQKEDLVVEKSSKKRNDNTDDVANVLGSIGAANILASRGLKTIFTTASIAVSPIVASASGIFPTATIFTTTSAATPSTRITRSSRGVII
ncbi:hypothetical protein Tco_1284190 [Tanacetum coccineum]